MLTASPTMLAESEVTTICSAKASIPTYGLPPVPSQKKPPLAATRSRNALRRFSGVRRDTVTISEQPPSASFVSSASRRRMSAAR